MNVNATELCAIKEVMLGDLFGLTTPGLDRVPVNVKVNQSPLVPSISTYYAFQEDHVRRLMLWLKGSAGRNLMITGPTGCGKSSVIEQFCARMGIELFRAACHGRMEFGELVGNTVILPDGSTKFIHGPLVLAMKTGAVLQLDEVNFLPPSMVGALNTVLDGGPLLIPETGELIQPHHDFRIAATGNSVERGDDAAHYAGTQRMNLAFKLRFLALKADYLTTTEEAAMLHRASPTLPAKVIEVMCGVAEDVRAAFKAGSLASVVSTRVSVKWAQIMTERLQALIHDPEKEMAFALQFVLTDIIDADDATAINTVLTKKVAGLVLAPRKAQVKKQTVMDNARKIVCLVHPAEQKFFVAVGTTAAGDDGIVFHGTMKPKLNFKPEKRCVSDVSMSQEIALKTDSENYLIASTVDVVGDTAEQDARDAIVALGNAYQVDYSVDIVCANANVQCLAEGLASQLGFLHHFVLKS